MSGAVNPANESTASFRECVLIRHPRHGEYAFAFITGTTVLQVGTPSHTVSGLNWLHPLLWATQDSAQFTGAKHHCTLLIDFVSDGV